MSVSEEIEKLLAPHLTASGFELVEVHYRKESGRWVLRLFVDKTPPPEGGAAPQGVTLDDCEKISGSAGALLDGSELITGSYVLEVSSPGINRVLKAEPHFLRFIGEKVKVALYAPLAPESRQKNFSGFLLSCEDGTITLDDAVSGRVNIPLAAVAKAHLDRI